MMSSEVRPPSLRLVRLERLLQKSFTVNYLELENESAKHAGHYQGDGETHWRLLLVAEEFRELTRVERHQRVNDLVQPEFLSGLHALSMKLLAPEEWAQTLRNF